MTSKNLKSAIWLTFAVGAVAFAAPGGVKGPPDDKGGKPTSEATNNLSVPAIMAGGMGAFGALACNDAALEETFTLLAQPDKGPLYYPYSCAVPRDEGELVCVTEGYYYVQRDAKWQAPCLEVGSATAEGAWGDNLAGSASLKVGSPIRVELVLWDSTGLATGQAGYYVIKLEPSELDRLSDYGHLADGGLDGPWFPHEYIVGTDEGFGAIVHDPDANLNIQMVDDDGNAVGDPVYDDMAGGEINATGKIVYGYTLRVGTAGTYRITYTLPNVTLSGCDEERAFCEGSTASLDIVVTGGGGGGRPPSAGE